MKDQSSPPTLLEISGAAYPAGRLAESVVVIVDAQRVYVDGRLPLPEIGSSLAEIARLLARARAAGTPVIHVVQHAISPPASPGSSKPSARSRIDAGSSAFRQGLTARLRQDAVGAYRSARTAASPFQGATTSKKHSSRRSPGC
jgi:nicotinamidase-related amidase